MNRDEHDIRKERIDTAMIDASDYNSLRQQVATLELKLRESEAACAVMRHALRELKVRIAYIGMPQEPHWNANGAMVPDWRSHISILENALHNSDAGKTILDELESAKAKQSEIRAEKDALITALWKRFYKVYKSECGALGFDDFVDRETKYIQIEFREP